MSDYINIPRMSSLILNDPSMSSFLSSSLRSARFKILKELSNTLQGRIYLVIDRINGKKYVLKEAWKQLVSLHRSRKGHNVPEDFLHERKMIFELTEKLTNNNFIIHGIDAWDDKDCYYYVMDLCSSELFDFIQKQHLIKNKTKDNDTNNEQSMMKEENEWIKIIKKIFKQICLAVHDMHFYGYCHLDLSLENTLICDKNNYLIKIIDFGLCKKFDINSKFRNKGRVGKLQYMCPEAYANKEYDARSADIYCLGIMLFMMLIGAPPYQEPTTNNTAFNYFINGRIAEVLLHWKRLKFVTSDALDLLNKIIKYESNRIDMDGILNHPFLQFEDEIIDKQILEIRTRQQRDKVLMELNSNQNPNNNLINNIIINNNNSNNTSIKPIIHQIYNNSDKQIIDSQAIHQSSVMSIDENLNNNNDNNNNNNNHINNNNNNNNNNNSAVVEVDTDEDMYINYDKKNVNEPNQKVYNGYNNINNNNNSNQVNGNIYHNNNNNINVNQIKNNNQQNGNQHHSKHTNNNSHDYNYITNHYMSDYQMNNNGNNKYQPNNHGAEYVVNQVNNHNSNGYHHCHPYQANKDYNCNNNSNINHFDEKNNNNNSTNNNHNGYVQNKQVNNNNNNNNGYYQQPHPYNNNNNNNNNNVNINTNNNPPKQSQKKNNNNNNNNNNNSKHIKNNGVPNNHSSHIPGTAFAENLLYCWQLDRYKDNLFLNHLTQANQWSNLTKDQLIIMGFAEIDADSFLDKCKEEFAANQSG